MDEVEAEFCASWDRVEAAYRDELELPHMPEMLALVQQMRAKGYDRTLRAGRSLGNLILSRARVDYLRPDQPCIGFVVSADGRMRVSYLNHQVLELPTTALKSDIERLLGILRSEPIT